MNNPDFPLLTPFRQSTELEEPATIERTAVSQQEADAVRPPLAAILLLTPLVLLVHGYHPYADDGALYAAEIKKLADPNLYRPDAVFVTAHSRLSLFPHILAGLARYGHLPLPGLLLACHLLSIALFLLGVWKVAEKIFTLRASRWGALLLAAACFTLPVAGTSLFLMDPYVTARSFSTPFSLFALAATLGGDWDEAVLWLLCAASMDFLMAGYAALFLLALALARHHVWRWLGAFAGLCFVTCAALFFATRHVPLSLPGSQADLSRSYFFLSSWRWYEYPGLVFPLLLFLLAVRLSRHNNAVREVSIAAAVMGGCALLISLCFVHRSGSLLLASAQPLRIFHPIYLAGLVLVGALAGRLLCRRACLAAGFYLGLGLAMFAGQRLTYPASAHVEWPGLNPPNPWQQAFLWIRANTPANAVFAMDADYILDRNEDAQGFRAIAERSALADLIKDGGIACINPAAQALWWHQVQATENLDRATDAERVARLIPMGATWILLPAASSTRLSCPYANSDVRVCSLGIR